MKNLISVPSRTIAIAAIAFSLIFFSSCTKNNDNNNSTPVAGLMAFNLAPDKPAIGFALSGNSLTNAALPYTSYTGGYLSIYAGTRPVVAFDANTNATIASTDYTFDKDKYYSLFLVGDTTFQNVVVSDNIDSLSGVSGNAYIRYINAIADSSKPTVTITQGGSNIVNENAAFASVSHFTPLTGGDVTLTVSNGSNIQASRTITLEQRKVYTALLVGVPGSTDSTKNIQIKYIENGTLSADSTNNGFSRVAPKAIKVN
ncbi:MAG: DUF4397 domain-containing protein [Agriterribacter sp.]